MKNRLGGVVIGQVIGLVIVCIFSSFVALVSFGGIAGVVMGTSTEQTFKYVAPLTCPKGTVDYQQYHASYDHPGENSVFVECVAPDGSRTDITLASIGYALVGFYLACFLPLCIPGGLVAIIVPLFFLRGKKQTPVDTGAIGSL